jgi:hypothetical protein
MRASDPPLSRALVIFNHSLCARLGSSDGCFVWQVYCVNIVFTRSKLSVFSIRYTTCVSERDARFHAGRPNSWCIKYSVTSSVKQTPACESATLPTNKTFVHIGHISLYLCHLPSFMCVTRVHTLTRIGVKSKPYNK